VQIQQGLEDSGAKLLVRLRAGCCFYADPLPPAPKKNGRPRCHGEKFGLQSGVEHSARQASRAGRSMELADRSGLCSVASGMSVGGGPKIPWERHYTSGELTRVGFVERFRRFWLRWELRRNPAGALRNSPKAVVRAERNITRLSRRASEPTENNSLDVLRCTFSSSQNSS
jgi:hypothetical protein